jgi:hypothetical protein
MAYIFIYSNESKYSNIFQDRNQNRAEYDDVKDIIQIKLISAFNQWHPKYSTDFSEQFETILTKIIIFTFVLYHRNHFGKFRGNK